MLTVPCISCVINIHSHHNHINVATFTQVLGKVNVDFVFGPGQRPKARRTKGKAKGARQRVDGPKSECLIKAFAACDIAEGEELLANYGNQFWKPVYTVNARRT
jgi:hypothetical protein